MGRSVEATKKMMGILATPPPPNATPPRNSRPYDQGLLTMSFP